MNNRFPRTMVKSDANLIPICYLKDESGAKLMAFVGGYESKQNEVGLFSYSFKLLMFMSCC